MTAEAPLPTLTARRIVLRSLGRSDAAALHAVFSDPEVLRYCGGSRTADLAAAFKKIEDTRDGFRARSFFQWGIARAADDLVIGTCTLHALAWPSRRAEIGFALGRSHWGQGLMSEALSALLTHAFGDLGLHRLEADTDPRNARAIRTLERQGFQHEGTLRERWIVDGEVQDALIYGLLARDWRERGQAHAARAAAGRRAR